MSQTPSGLTQIAGGAKVLLSRQQGSAFRESCRRLGRSLAPPCVAALALFLFTGCATPKAAPVFRDPASEVRAVLARQVEDWNRGSVDDFMKGYARSPGTRFASGGDLTLGWDTVRDRYRTRYDDRAKMGRLNFTGVDVTVVSPDAALVFGHWRLERAADAPSGLFTLLFLRTPEGWRIVHDHTSAASPP